jgi:hypothetical protein
MVPNGSDNGAGMGGDYFAAYRRLPPELRVL